jgi:hypothetical protein
MLYVPVRDEIKLKAKAYIDVGIEKGVGKVVSGLVIMGLLLVMDYRQVAWVSAASPWYGSPLALTGAPRVRAHSGAIHRGRFASLRGVFASLMDASTLPVVKQALAHESPLRSAFALELARAAARQTELRRRGDRPGTALVDHEHAGDSRGCAPAAGPHPRHAVDPASRSRNRLLDASPIVREAAVRALVATAGDARPRC